MSHKSLDDKININIKAFKKKVKNKEFTKAKLINKNKDFVKDVYLPLTLNDSKNTTRTYKELKPTTNINQNFYKNLSCSKYLLSLRDKKSSTKKKILFSGKADIIKNINKTKLNFTSTVQSLSKQSLTYYKNNKDKSNNYFSNNEIDNNKTNAKEKEENSNNIRLCPIVQKISLRNIICDKKFHEIEIRKLINNKNENNNNNEITKINKEDKLSYYFKHKKNNMKKRNFSNHINQCDTFNKIHDSSIILNNTNGINIKDNSSKIIEKFEKNLFFQNVKNDLNDTNKIKSIDCYKTYFLKYTQKRKKNNEDILQVLNISNND